MDSRSSGRCGRALGSPRRPRPPPPLPEPDSPSSDSSCESEKRPGEKAQEASVSGCLPRQLRVPGLPLPTPYGNLNGTSQTQRLLL